MRISPQLVLATLNRHKFEEFQTILKTYPEVQLTLFSQLVRNPEKLEKAEQFSSYAENAIAKARIANLGCHYPALADDSGLEVDALGGRPGVLSHRFSPPRPHLSQDQANTQLLLQELKSASQRKARFVCHLALVVEGILVQATGTLEGSIAEEPRGTDGFGYDPLFIPEGQHKTLAEMCAEEKNRISHRAVAIHNLMNNIKSLGLVLTKP